LPLSWRDKYTEGLREKKTLLVVGLDPTPESLPPQLKKEAEGDEWWEPVGNYLKGIVEETHELVLGYKMNSAFYEGMGPDGLGTMLEVKKHAERSDSSLLLIFDGKRGDISHTAESYSSAIYDIWGFDATTISPYMGWDAVEPFYRRVGKLTILLVRTSNPSGGEVQMWGEPPLYLRIAELIAERDPRGDLGAVVGATHPKELKEIRNILGRRRAILVPGVGVQGGDAAEVLKQGEGVMLVNVSRGVILGWKKGGWPRGVKEAAKRFSAALKVHQPQRFI